MKIVNLIAAAAVVASTTGVQVAFAEQAAGCSCVTKGASAGEVGSFISANGSVMASGAKDYVNARAGTPISVGSEISVGGESSAEIAVGTCALSLVPNSVTRVSAQEGGSLCVASVQTTTTTASYGQPMAQNTRSLVPLYMWGSLAGGAAILSLVGNKSVRGSISR